MNRAMSLVEQLCSVTVDRRPGSDGNEEAVDFVATTLTLAGWTVSLPEFPCLDWIGGPASVTFGRDVIPLVPSPYGMGVDAEGPVRVVASMDDLGRTDLGGSILVVEGDLASEPLTPKAFPFYESEEHAAIIDRLETIRPLAIVAVTGKYPELCGALDPFPWIEDGDFERPAAAIRREDARGLLEAEGRMAQVSIEATRIPSSARNVAARLGPEGPRVTICAHIDTKPGTPGAVDNATGVATLVLIGEELGRMIDLPIGVELLAVNGEDHFAGPGEVAWLADNEGHLDDVKLFINIDGAGYRNGRTAYSLYNVDDDWRAATIRRRLDTFDDLYEGPSWYQSDHAIFAMQGRSALAFTTEFVDEMLVELFHSENDTIDQVSSVRVESIASALKSLIGDW